MSRTSFLRDDSMPFIASQDRSSMTPADSVPLRALGPLKERRVDLPASLACAIEAIAATSQGVLEPRNWPRGRDESWQLRDNAKKEMTSVEEKEKCDQRTMKLGRILNLKNYVGDQPKMCHGFNCTIEDFKARCKLSLTTPSFSCHRKGHSCLYLTEFQGKGEC